MKRIGLLLPLLLLAATGVSRGAELASFENFSRSPVFWTLREEGAVNWGRWFVDRQPGECYSETPGWCREARGYVAVSNGSGDDPAFATYTLDWAHDWTFLGYGGHLGYRDTFNKAETLRVFLLKENYKEEHPFELCTVSAGLYSAHIKCAPLDLGVSRDESTPLRTVKPSVSDLTSMDRLMALTDAPLPLAIYQEAAVRVAEDTGDETYSTRLFFILGASGHETAYATTPGEHWRFESLSYGPYAGVAEAPFEINLIRAAPENGMPTLCAVRMDMASAMVERCTPLLEPTTGAKTEAGGGGAATPEEQKR